MPVITYKARHGGTCLLPQNWAGDDRATIRAYWSANLTSLASSRPVGDLVSKVEGVQLRGKIPGIDLCSPHRHAYRHTYVYTCSYIHTQLFFFFLHECRGQNSGLHICMVFWLVHKQLMEEWIYFPLQFQVTVLL